MTRLSLSALRESSDLRLRRLQLAMFSEIDSDAILEFASTVASATTKKAKTLLKAQKQQAKKISSQGIALEILNTYVEDQFSLAEEVGHLADKLAIVALFGQVELSYKAMIGIAIPGIDESRLFRWADVKKALQGQGIDFKTVKSYAEVNQLRCLNNAIKHGKNVGTELAATGWGRASDKIDANKCSEALYDFVDHGELFIGDLKTKLLHLINTEKPKAG